MNVQLQTIYVYPKGKSLALKAPITPSHEKTEHSQISKPTCKSQSRHSLTPNIEPFDGKDFFISFYYLHLSSMQVSYVIGNL